MPTISLNFNPLSVLVSMMILSGIFTHGVHAGNLITEFSSNSEHKHDLLSSGKHIHIDINTFSNSTHDLRSHTPANRPRDDEDKNHTIKKRVSGDGFGNNFSSSINL